MTYQSNIELEDHSPLSEWIDSGRSVRTPDFETEIPLCRWMAHGRLPREPQDEALALMFHELPTEFLEDFVRDAPEGLLKLAAADIVAMRAGAYGASTLPA